jgi:hypothetical protein
MSAIGTVSTSINPAVSAVDVEFFRRTGYCVAKAVFSPKEVGEMRQRLMMVREHALQVKAFDKDPKHPNMLLILGDLLSKPELRGLRYLLFDERVLSCAKQILGPQLVYFGDSSIQCGEGVRGFHKDNVDRTDGAAPDWQSSYTLVRFGIYLQDHSRYSGGLKLKAGSQDHASKFWGKAINLPIEAGDLAMWNMRITHSGNFVRLRGAPDLCLHPRIETLIPHWMRVPEQLERFAVFGTFAAPGEHLERYLKYVGGRTDYKPHFERSAFTAEIETWLTSEGILFRRAVPEHGSLG